MASGLIETVSYNSEAFLDKKLRYLVDTGTIEFGHYVWHESEKGEKAQWQILIKLARPVKNLASLKSHFIENGSCGATDFLTVSRDKNGGLRGWLLYAIHDPSFAEGKRQLPRDAVKSTSPEILKKHWAQFVDNPQLAQKKSPKNIILEAGENGGTLYDALKQDEVGVSPMMGNYLPLYVLGRGAGFIGKILENRGIKKEDADYEQKRQEMQRFIELTLFPQLGIVEHAVEMLTDTFTKTKQITDVDESEMTKTALPKPDIVTVPTHRQCLENAAADFMPKKAFVFTPATNLTQGWLDDFLKRRYAGDAHTYNILRELERDQENPLRWLFTTTPYYCNLSLVRCKKIEVAEKNKVVRLMKPTDKDWYVFVGDIKKYPPHYRARKYAYRI